MLKVTSSNVPFFRRLFRLLPSDSWNHVWKWRTNPAHLITRWWLDLHVRWQSFSSTASCYMFPWSNVKQKPVCLDSTSIDPVNKLPPSEDYISRHTHSKSTPPCQSLLSEGSQVLNPCVPTHTPPSHTDSFMSSFETALIACILMMAPGYELPVTADWSSIPLMVMKNWNISCSYSQSPSYPLFTSALT